MITNGNFKIPKICQMLYYYHLPSVKPDGNFQVVTVYKIISSGLITTIDFYKFERVLLNSFILKQ